MPTAYSYIRFSSKKQEKGDSLRRQTADRQAFCNRHKLTLDDTLRLRDLGVSAFKGKNEKDGDLGVFLFAVQAGTVPPGSWLLIENLDRLSRQEPMTSLGLVKRLIDARITVASMTENLVLSRGTIDKEPSLLFQMLGSLIRAHEESKRKSEMVRAAKEARRKLIASGQLTAAKGLRPSWVDRVGNKFALNAAKAATVRRIVRMGTEGMGYGLIVQTLNAERVPPIGTAKGWTYSTVQYLLQSRTLIGEYQQITTHTGTKVKAGEPIKGYYPAVITEGEFYTLQNAIAARRVSFRGRTGKQIANLFGDLLVSGTDGGRLWIQYHRTAPKLVSSNARKGGARWIGFPYRIFEAEFFKWVKEVEVRTAKPDSAELDAKNGRLWTVQTNLKKLQSAGVEDFDSLIVMAKQLETEAKKLKAEIEAETAKQHAGPASTRDITRLAAEMQGMPDAERVRLRSQLRAAIGRVVTQIRLYIYGNNNAARVVYAQVKMVDGQDRIFSVVTRKGKPPVGRSDNTLGKADTDYQWAFDQWAADELAGVDRP